MSHGPAPATFPDPAEWSGVRTAPVPSATPLDEAGDDATTTTLERIRRVRTRLETNAVTVKLTARAAEVPVVPARPAPPSIRWALGAATVVVLTLGLLWSTTPRAERGAEPVAPDPAVLMAQGFEQLDIDPVAAVSVFHEALSVAPNDPALMSGLGQALAAAGRREEARSWLCQGVRAPGAIGHAAEAALLRHRMHCP